MCAESLSTIYYQVLEKKIAAAIDSAKSLDEIESWLKSLKCVKSVQLADYLLKSNPPQRDFIVEFCMLDGSTIKKVINLYDLGNQQYKFHRLRDR